DEAAVDLQERNRQAVQVGERSEPGPEIVEGEPSAEAHHPLGEGARGIEFLDRRGLGDLEHQVRRARSDPAELAVERIPQPAASASCGAPPCPPPVSQRDASLRPSTSLRSASTVTPSPASPAASLVIGPIETTRAREGRRSPSAATKLRTVDEEVKVR